MMKRFYCDLHNHSCLFPCADDDNTPNDLLGMASISGIEILALTDHNTAKNCPAFFKAAARYGIIPVAGVELTTSEDIHAVCLFESLEGAMEFDAFLDAHRAQVENRPSIFGKQQIMNENDEVIGEEKYLLSVATDISIEDAPSIVERFGGVCYPAHIDRDANGIISTLGTFPETPSFNAVEFHNAENVKDYTERYSLFGKTVVVSSDAHYLTDMREGEFSLLLDCDGSDGDLVRKLLIRKLRGERG